MFCLCGAEMVEEKMMMKRKMMMGKTTGDVDEPTGKFAVPTPDQADEPLALERKAKQFTLLSICYVDSDCHRPKCCCRHNNSCSRWCC